MNTSRITISLAAASVAGFLALLGSVLIASHAEAQFGLPGIEGALSITISPSSPSPGETVRLTVRSSVLDLSESTIVWRAGGTIIAQGTGATFAEATLGALGVATIVEVSATLGERAPIIARATIIPTELDLLVDSDSYIPPFYWGAALPSAGTNVRLVAIPRFKRPNGSYVASSDITYTWRRNDEVIAGASGRGASSAVIEAPHLFGTDRIEVEARTSDGLLSNVAGRTIASVEPALLLYQDHPLFGILYRSALSASTFIPESEMTFAAEPYFVQARSAKDPVLQYVWNVNDAPVTPSRINPNEITINADNSSGVAHLTLGLTHATNFYVDTRAAWNINFSSQTSATNPFGNFAP